MPFLIPFMGIPKQNGEPGIGLALHAGTITCSLILTDRTIEIEKGPGLLLPKALENEQYGRPPHGRIDQIYQKRMVFSRRLLLNKKITDKVSH